MRNAFVENIRYVLRPDS